MRANLALFVFTCFMGVILWVTLSGALFLIGLGLLLLFIVISIGYSDTAVLFFLGARELRSADEGDYHDAAVQEAYKLAVPRPKLYFYNGALDRAFVLQNNKDISLILSKELLVICTKNELAAICFELLLQVKKNLARKRTKMMMMVGMVSWMSHGVIEGLAKIIQIKEFRYVMNLLMYYLIHPWISFIFKITLGKKYFKKLGAILQDYPKECDSLQKVGLKLKATNEIYSLSSRKIIEFSSVNKNRHFQNIMTLEFLPHEWDLIFDPKLEASA
jgi:hypothetical protein